ncbi:hypothetical protein BKA82DRAFT_4362456 [Pisolithus tinctorius]|nr:hypothetical protein BKA82DRAFT_4362456 [Pisolithus tinctorius]
MAKSAWDSVSRDTIKHCWDHTQIQLDSPNAPLLSPSSHPPHADPVGWQIIREFATTEMSLPNAEAHLAAHLGCHYVDVDWQPALTAVMDAEGDASKSAFVHTLHQCNRIFGEPLSLEEILNPSEEQQKCENFDSSELTDKAIASSVRQEMAVSNGDVIDIDSDSDDVDVEDSGPTITCEGVLALHEQLESACLTFGDAASSLELSRQLRIFRAHI